MVIFHSYVKLPEGSHYSRDESYGKTMINDDFWVQILIAQLLPGLWWDLMELLVAKAVVTSILPLFTAIFLRYLLPDCPLAGRGAPG